jgi:restriction system protein
MDKLNQEVPSIIEVAKLSLEEWLDLVRNPPKDAIFADYEFPTAGHKEQYLASIEQRPDKEVRLLIRRFLISSGSLGIDQQHFKWIAKAARADPGLLDREWNRRLLTWHLSNGKSPPPWEGITWIIDLLPRWPKEALRALDAYFLAHAQQLPDGRLAGLGEAGELIRAKFIGTPTSLQERVNTLKEISPRAFEHVIERLYDAMGYVTQITPPSRDGGRDVIATRTEPTRAEQLRIQCKRYESSVGVTCARELLGVVSSEKVSKGVLITTSRFTKPARDFGTENPRIELIHGQGLVALLNEHLGAKWPLEIEHLVLESQQAHTREYVRRREEIKPASRKNWKKDRAGK